MGKTIGVFGILCFCGAVLAIAYMAGVVAGMREMQKKKLAEYGLTPATVKLAVRARKILVRLNQVTDLDGLRAGDDLSPETKQLVNQWVADYRKEVQKG